MRKTEILAYTAGIIDGEGCISLSSSKSPSSRTGKRVELVVRVCNTSEWLINWLHFQFGGWITPQRPNGPKCKPIWAWNIKSRGALEFLESVEPYLNLKKPQAELAIKFQRGKRRSGPLVAGVSVLQEADRILMMKLNKRGV